MLATITTAIELSQVSLFFIILSVKSAIPLPGWAIWPTLAFLFSDVPVHTHRNRVESFPPTSSPFP